MNTATLGEFLATSGNPIATVKGYAVYDMTFQGKASYFIVNVDTKAVESGRLETSSKMIGNTECVTMVETCAFPSLDTALTAIVDDLVNGSHASSDCYCTTTAHKH
jgi:hypothetical protein